MEKDETILAFSQKKNGLLGGEDGGAFTDSRMESHPTTASEEKIPLPTHWRSRLGIGRTESPN